MNQNSDAETQRQPVGPLLYGGTFDPVHAGHLAVARSVAQAAGQTVYLMPAKQPPHRSQPGANDQQRLAMLKLALGSAIERDGMPATMLAVDDRELRRMGPSYSVLTLRECVARGERPGLILGWDAFCGLPSWHEFDAIIGLAVFIVLPRSRSLTNSAVPTVLKTSWLSRRALSPKTLARASAGDVLFCAMPEHPASATAIRSAIQSGARFPADLPAAVAHYIDEQKLYAS